MLQHGASAPALSTGLMSLLNRLGVDLKSSALSLFLSGYVAVLTEQRWEVQQLLWMLWSFLPKGNAEGCSSWVFWRQRLLKPPDSMEASNQEAVCISEKGFLCSADGVDWC